jgi:hypothetical protein
MASARPQRDGYRSAAGREVGAMLLFAEDVRVAWLLLNAARYRALERMLGTTPEQANLVTFVAAAVIVDAAQSRTSQIKSPRPPAPTNIALSAAMTGSALSAIAGQTGIAGPGSLLIAAAILYRLVGTPSRRAFRGVARAPFRLRTAVMGQGQRLASAAAERARQAAAERNPETPTTGVTS